MSCGGQVHRVTSGSSRDVELSQTIDREVVSRDVVLKSAVDGGDSSALGIRAKGECGRLIKLQSSKTTDIGKGGIGQSVRIRDHECITSRTDECVVG